MSEDIYKDIVGQIENISKEIGIFLHEVKDESKTTLTFKAGFGENGWGKFSNYFKKLREFFLKLESIPNVDYVFPIEFFSDPLDDLYDFTIKIQLTKDLEKTYSERKFSFIF